MALYHALTAYLPVAIDFLVNRREVSEIRIAQGMDGFQWARILARPYPGVLLFKIHFKFFCSATLHLAISNM